jgi:hypothetical protein
MYSPKIDAKAIEFFRIYIYIYKQYKKYLEKQYILKSHK